VSQIGRLTNQISQWRRQLWGTRARAPRTLKTISFFFHFGVNLTSNYPLLCSLRDQLVQMSTIHSSVDQYCISHKTISHGATAAPGPEVRHECPMTYFTALPLLATNPGDATEISYRTRITRALWQFIGRDMDRCTFYEKRASCFIGVTNASV